MLHIQTHRHTQCICGTCGATRPYGDGEEEKGSQVRETGEPMRNPLARAPSSRHGNNIICHLILRERVRSILQTLCLLHKAKSHSAPIIGPSPPLCGSLGPIINAIYPSNLKPARRGGRSGAPANPLYASFFPNNSPITLHHHTVFLSCGRKREKERWPFFLPMSS